LTDETEGLNELVTLECLRAGLATLSWQVGQIEAPIIADEVNRRKRITFYGFGMFDQDTERLLPCLFRWFGVSICNYARLTGFLSGLSSQAYTREQAADPSYHGIVRQHCSTYVDSVSELDSIKIWRNKVFAHFAITDPRKDDNPALLDASVMSPIVFSDSRLRVGGMIITQNEHESSLPAWSVTEAFESLSARYWPNSGAQTS
jgi:hypothetical protein